MRIGDLVFYKGFVHDDTDPPSLEYFSNLKLGLIISVSGSIFQISTGGHLWWTCTNGGEIFKDWEMLIVSKLDR